MWLCFVSLYNDQCFVWNWWTVDFHSLAWKINLKRYYYISIIWCRVSKSPRDKILLRAKRFETRHNFIVSFLYCLTLSFEDVGSILYFFYIFTSMREFNPRIFPFDSLFNREFFFKKERFAGILSLMKSGTDMQKFVSILFSLLFNTTFTHES